MVEVSIGIRKCDDIVEKFIFVLWFIVKLYVNFYVY